MTYSFEKKPMNSKKKEPDDNNFEHEGILDAIKNESLYERLQRIGKSHSREFYGEIKHDTNFNNIEKTRNESMFSVRLIRNPDSVISTVNKLAMKLSEVISVAKKNGNAGEELIKFLEKDTGSDGQYGRIYGEIDGILQSKASTPLNFIQKMLLIKSFGAFLIDFVSKKPERYSALLLGKSAENLSSAISEYRPDDLFNVRGRSGIKSAEYREDSGILDKTTFNGMSDNDKNLLIIPGLTKKRPLFRTFTNEKINDQKVLSKFVNRTFNADNPLIASISGSTSCIMVSSYILEQTMSQNDKFNLAKSAVAFLVGGGYHSATEILDVAYPGLSFDQLSKGN
uniref:hypothetical protein n=1 Tax=Photorhabdus sp. RM322S TaxID=3342825 RepID=UPI0036D9999A